MSIVVRSVLLDEKLTCSSAWWNTFSRFALRALCSICSSRSLFAGITFRPLSALLSSGNHKIKYSCIFGTTVRYLSVRSRLSGGNSADLNRSRLTSLTAAPTGRRINPMRILITVTSFCKDLTGSASIRYACSRFSLRSCGTCGSSLSCWPLLSGISFLSLRTSSSRGSLISLRDHKVKYRRILSTAVCHFGLCPRLSSCHTSHLDCSGFARLSPTGLRQPGPGNFLSKRPQQYIISLYLDLIRFTKKQLIIDIGRWARKTSAESCIRYIDRNLVGRVRKAYCTGLHALPLRTAWPPKEQCRCFPDPGTQYKGLFSNPETLQNKAVPTDQP